MAAQGIPFSQEDRATIRSTAMWMLIAGAIMTLCGLYMYFSLYEPLMTYGLDVVLGPLALPLLVTNGMLGLGILIVVASRKFARVAEDGSISALGSGLTALTIVYVVQAVLMLLGMAFVALFFLLPWFLH
jgi:hypothetical protein